MGTRNLRKRTTRFLKPTAEKLVGFLFPGMTPRINAANEMNHEQTTLVQNLRALPRGAWILFFGTFLNKFGTFVMPFLALYMTRLGYTPAQAGLGIGSYGCGILCASLLGGDFAGSLCRGQNILLSLVFGAAGLALL